MFGLITKSRHEREMRELKAKAARDIVSVTDDRNQWRDKSMDQSVEIADLKANFLRRLAVAVQDYQADALAHRARLKRDREQKAAKRAARQ